MPFRSFLLGLSLFLVGSPLQAVEAQLDDDENGLAQAYEDSFLIGAAIAPVHYDDQHRAVIDRHFNAVVAENVMKSMYLQPEEGQFFFDDADEFVQFGVAMGAHITGHTLAWYLQAPDWLFVDDSGQDVSREVLLARMRTHIHTVIERYRGRIQSWDVVNEAIEDDGQMRQCKFYQIIGPDWVEHMFRFAAEADPDAKLYYNDYSLANPAKREGVYRLINSIQNNGVRVDGIGMQQHITVNDPDLGAIEASIVRLSELGEVLITELDVTVLPYPSDNLAADVTSQFEYEVRLNPYAEGLPNDVAADLDQRFVDLFPFMIDTPKKSLA